MALDPVLEADFDTAWTTYGATYESDATASAVDNQNGYNLAPIIISTWCADLVGHATAKSRFETVLDNLLANYDPAAGGANTINDLQTAMGMAFGHLMFPAKGLDTAAQALVTSWEVSSGGGTTWPTWRNYQAIKGFWLDQAIIPAIVAALTGWTARITYALEIATNWRASWLDHTGGSVIWDLGKFPPADSGHLHGAPDFNHSWRHTLLAFVYYAAGVGVFSKTDVRKLGALLTNVCWNGIETVTDIQSAAGSPRVYNYIDGDNGNYRNVQYTAGTAAHPEYLDYGYTNGLWAPMYFMLGAYAPGMIPMGVALYNMMKAYPASGTNSNAFVWRNKGKVGNYCFPATLMLAKVGAALTAGTTESGGRARWGAWGTWGRGWV